MKDAWKEIALFTEVQSYLRGLIDWQIKLISSKRARSGSSSIRVSTNTLFKRSALIYVNTRSFHAPPEFATKTSKTHRPRGAALAQKPIKVKRNIVEGAPQHKTKSLWISLQNLSSNPHFTVNDVSV